MTYPILIFFTLIVVGVIILVYVMPQLEKVFSDTGVKLPALTRGLLALSHAVSTYWWIFLAALIGLVIAFKLFLKTKAGIHTFDTFKIKMPILKGIFIKIYSARFARTCHTLISSGVPLNQIFETVGQVINNSIYAKELDNVAELIKSGKPFSNSIEQTKKFPHLISSLLKVGEKSGKTDYVMETLADYFEREVDQATSNMSALIEPVIMLVLGVAVALIVFSVLMPIYGLVNTI